MKYREAFKRLAHDGRTFDQDALTVEEAAKLYFPDFGVSTVRERLKRAVAYGNWQQVFKRNPDGRVCKAYRPKK